MGTQDQLLVAWDVGTTHAQSEEGRHLSYIFFSFDFSSCGNFQIKGWYVIFFLGYFWLKVFRGFRKKVLTKGFFVVS